MRYLPALLLPLLVSCDAWRLESAARSKCEQGLALVKKAAGLNRAEMSEPDRVRTLAVLQEAHRLLKEGMESYAKAEEKTGKSYEVAPYLEARKVCRMMLMEMKD